MMTTVHEATWELLRAVGVRTVFGNPGSTEMPFLADFPPGIDYARSVWRSALLPAWVSHTGVWPPTPR
jgi:benzoylformate decarboxylase